MSEGLLFVIDRLGQALAAAEQENQRLAGENQMLQQLLSERTAPDPEPPNCV